jgi:hypothetical protein
MYIYNLQTGALEKPSFGVLLLLGRGGEGRKGCFYWELPNVQKKLVNGPITKCSPTISYFHNVLLIDVAKARVLHLPHKKIDVTLISFSFHNN